MWLHKRQKRQTRVRWKQNHVLRSKCLNFVAIEKDLKESHCLVSRQSISKFVRKYENSPLPLSQSLLMTRKERLTMEMYDFIYTQMENNDELTSAGELWFVVCNSTNVKAGFHITVTAVKRLAKVLRQCCGSAAASPAPLRSTLSAAP